MYNLPKRFPPLTWDRRPFVPRDVHTQHYAALEKSIIWSQANTVENLDVKSIGKRLSCDYVVQPKDVSSSPWNHIRIIFKGKNQYLLYLPYKIMSFVAFGIIRIIEQTIFFCKIICYSIIPETGKSMITFSNATMAYCATTVYVIQ